VGTGTPADADNQDQQPSYQFHIINWRSELGGSIWSNIVSIKKTSLPKTLVSHKILLVGRSP